MYYSFYFQFGSIKNLILSYLILSYKFLFVQTLSNGTCSALEIPTLLTATVSCHSSLLLYPSWLPHYPVKNNYLSSAPIQLLVIVLKSFSPDRLSCQIITVTSWIQNHNILLDVVVSVASSVRNFDFHLGF